MSSVEKKSIDSFSGSIVIPNFLGKHTSSNYEEQFKKLLDSFRSLGVRMSVKMHFLRLHLDYFPKNCGDYSGRGAERYHTKTFARWKKSTKELGCKHVCRLLLALKKRSS